MHHQIRGYGNLTLDEQFAFEAKLKHQSRIRTMRRTGDKRFLETMRPQELRILSNAKAK